MDELGALEVGFEVDLDDLTGGFAGAKSQADAFGSAIVESNDMALVSYGQLASGVGSALSSISEETVSVSSSLDEMAGQGGAAGSDLIGILGEILDAINALRETAIDMSNGVTDSLLSIENSTNDVRYSIEEMSSSVSGSIENLDVQFASVGESAAVAGEEISSAGEHASGSGGWLNFFNQIGIGIFSIQNMIQVAGQLTGALLGPAMSAEEVTSSLEIFTGSAAKAKKELGDLASFAAHTPFETQAIDDAALKMQSVGINAHDVIPYILSLGDALDATGRISSADLDQIVNAFDKIKTEGHLTTDVMNSFALSGIDAWGVLEAQTGKTHAQLAELISKGLYPADQAMKDLTEGIEKSPIYKGQMANDANLLTGAISTLKSNWDQILASFGSPIIKGLEPIINNLSADLSSPAFKDFAGSIGQGIVAVFLSIGSAGASVGTMLHGLSQGGGLSALASGFKEVQSIVGGELGKDFRLLGQETQELGKWWQSSMLPAIHQAEPGFTKLGTVLATDVAPAIAKVWAVGEKLSREALPPLTKAFEKIEPVVVRVGGFLAGELAQGIQKITPDIVQASQAIGKFAGDIETRVAPVLAGLSTDLHVFLDWIGPYWPSIWQGISNELTMVWDVMKGVVQIAWALISGTIKVGLDLASGNWKKAWTDVKDTFSGVWEGIKNIAIGVWTGIGGGIKSGINAVIGELNSFIRSLDSLSVDIGPVHIHPGIPQIPYLAAGGIVPPGGMAIAGDPGPNEELVLGGTSGATVLSNAQSSQLLARSMAAAGAGGGRGSDVHVHIYLDSQEIAHYTAPAAAEAVVAKLYGFGPVRRAA